MRQSLVKLHPKTGMPLVPVGFRKNGSAIWPILGASEDGAGEGEGNPDPEGDGADDGDDDDDDAGSGADDSASKDPRIKELSDEAARNRVKAKEAQKALEEAQKRLKEFEDKDKSETEKMSGELEALRTDAKIKDEQLRELRLNNAFLTSNKYTWHNPERALKLADLSEVEIDEDGKVTGLDKALEALAKSDPYLIKKADEEDDDKSGASGEPLGTGKGSKKKTADRARLEAKYPGLRK